MKLSLRHLVSVGTLAGLVVVPSLAFAQGKDPQPQPQPADSQPQPQPQPQPEPEPQPLPKTSSGISPIFFFAGVGLTAGLGIASIAAGGYTSSVHADFVRMGCPATNNQDCRNRASSGSTAQTATNILVAGMGVAAVATIVSIFFVRWKAPVQAASDGIRITF